MDTALAAEGWLTLGEGNLQFMRGHVPPAEVLVWMDAGLLAAIVAGDLGPVSWDLLDGDYRSWQATGDSLGSFAEFLDARASGDPDHDRPGLEPHEVDVRHLWDEAEIAAAIRAHFGVPPG